MTEMIMQLPAIDADLGIFEENAKKLIREQLIRSGGVAEEKLRQLERPWTPKECGRAVGTNSATAGGIAAFTAQEIGKSVGKMMDDMILGTLKTPMNIREHVEAWYKLGLTPAIVDEKRHGLIHWDESRSCAFYVEDPVMVPDGLSILSENVGKWRVRTVALDETPMLAHYWAIERAAIAQEFPNTGTCLVTPRRKP